MEFLVAFVVFLVVAACLALGVLVGREPLRGTCGGIACSRCRKAAECRQGKREQARRPSEAEV